jgi:hypothetical protein
MLKEELALENIELKIKKSLILQTNPRLIIFYENLAILNKDLKKNYVKMSSIEELFKNYRATFKEIYVQNKVRPSLENLLNLNLVEKFDKYQYLYDIKNELNIQQKLNLQNMNDNAIIFQKKNQSTNIKDILTKLELENNQLPNIVEERIKLDAAARLLIRLKHTHIELINEFNIISAKFMLESNSLLQSKIHFLDEQIRDLTLKENAFLDVHKAFLPYLNLYNKPNNIIIAEKLENHETQATLLKKAM